jgi:putative copper resistance protein D
MSNLLLAPDFFGALGRNWGGSLLEDQRLGGGIAWGIGELPTLSLMLILAMQWTRSDDREARRRDRAADRDGDAELNAYNAMLADLADSDTRRATQEAGAATTRDTGGDTPLDGTCATEAGRRDTKRA